MGEGLWEEGRWCVLKELAVVFRGLTHQLLESVSLTVRHLTSNQEEQVGSGSG